MLRYHMTLVLAAVFAISLQSQEKRLPRAEAEAQTFLALYNPIYRSLSTVSAEAQWKSSTDVKEQHTGERIGADNAVAAFVGNPAVIERCRALLRQRKDLRPLTVKQLEKVMYAAAHFPGTIPGLVKERVETEAQQSAILDGFRFCYESAGDSCAKVVTPNQIDDILRTSTDLKERKHVWEVSKQTGPALKPGLIALRRLRNAMAKEMGFSSYFGLQVSDYGMSTAEMMALMRTSLDQVKPLYEQMHHYARKKYAGRYGQPVPNKIPAHWIGNRWSQAWPGIVEGVNLDDLFKDRSPEWIVQQAERFYISLGMPALPPSFWETSDLYDLPPGATRRKNTHASAWHIDLEQDVRSLMSVKPDYDWFETTHHELGHIYYYLAYSRPEVPLQLREGANRAFHEAVGDLIGIAARQIPYLKEVGVMPQDMQIDRTQWLLNEAFDNAVVFIPWSAGVMSHWEHDLYESSLTPDEFNKRWWEYVGRFQGVEPPGMRDETACDAATKTHVIDDPAQYYDYAMAFLIKYQLHLYIANNILKQDPHHCNYYGNKEVGRWLWELLQLGATKDWRQVIKEKTGEEISARAMLEYFQPVMEYLKVQNGDAKVGWD